MEIESFIDDLIRGVEKDDWEPTDTGYQLTSRNFVVKVRQSGDSGIELAVEGYDGKEIARTFQKPVSEGADDSITLKLSYLYQNLTRKPIDKIAALDDVIRELRTGRGSL